MYLCAEFFIDMVILHINHSYLWLQATRRQKNSLTSECMFESKTKTYERLKAREILDRWHRQTKLEKAFEGDSYFIRLSG